MSPQRTRNRTDKDIAREFEPEAAKIRAEAARMLEQIKANPKGHPMTNTNSDDKPRDGIDDTATLLVATRLRTLRKARGWSLAVACTHLASIGVAALSRIERGERQITISDLAELAGGYGVSIADLVAPGDICDACGQEIPR